MTDRPLHEHLQAIANRRMTRRDWLATSGVLATGLFGVGSGMPRVLAGTDDFDFHPVASNTLDTVTVPTGFTWQVVASWGDPLWATGEPFNEQTRGTAASQALAFGDCNDGMASFFKDGKTILAVNNEYITKNLFARGGPRNSDDVRKGMMAHGVSLFEVRDFDGRWQVVLDSPFNRRITPSTPTNITGPARGHPLLSTTRDPTAIRAAGTWNNCGSGKTPWGTYLTCEENFVAYFSVSQPNYELTTAMKRYGVSHRDAGFRWASLDDRFDIAKEPNEVNRVGYVVEIDPLRPESTPRKLTALGRFKHENAECVLAKDGRVVVYMGDDEAGEFLYRYVSTSRYVAGQPSDQLLEDGRLFVARFRDDGSGRWLALTPETTAMISAAEICIHTRLAASAVGATTLDRPEWVAADKRRGDIYCALTNNTARGRKSNAGGDEMPVGGPNPRARNRYGQIVRWTPRNDDHGDEEFEWDLFVVAGNPDSEHESDRSSPNVDADNLFNSPDGLAFDSQGRLWIQTDGDTSNRGAFAGHGNNQMLLGDPVTGTIHRFLVGPVGCEIAGLCWSEDKRTMFVGIQHPGGRNAHFPGGGQTVPRSSVVAIRRADKHPIG